MSVSFSQLLPEITACLNEMKINCKEEKWEEFYKNDEKRQKIMNQLKAVKTTSYKDNIDSIKNVVKLNEEVINLVESNKENIEKALLTIKRNKKKTSFYQ